MSDFGGREEAERLRKIHTIDHGMRSDPSMIRDTIGNDSRNDSTTGRTIYPAFWQATHRSWNAFAGQYRVMVMPTEGHEHLLPEGYGAVPRCDGPDSGEYDPGEHPFCFDLAQSLRVSLHAAGIRLIAGAWIE